MVEHEPVHQRAVRPPAARDELHADIVPDVHQVALALLGPDTGHRLLRQGMQRRVPARGDAVRCQQVVQAVGEVRCAGGLQRLPMRLQRRLLLLGRLLRRQGGRVAAEVREDGQRARVREGGGGGGGGDGCCAAAARLGRREADQHRVVLIDGVHAVVVQRAEQVVGQHVVVQLEGRGGGRGDGGSGRRGARRREVGEGRGTELGHAGNDGSGVEEERPHTAH